MQSDIKYTAALIKQLAAELHHDRTDDVFRVVSASQVARGAEPVPKHSVFHMVEALPDISPRSSKSDVAFYPDGEVRPGCDGDKICKKDALVVHCSVLSELYEHGYPEKGVALANELLGRIPEYDPLRTIADIGVLNLETLENLPSFNKDDLAVAREIFKKLDIDNVPVPSDFTLRLTLSALGAPGDHVITHELRVEEPSRTPSLAPTLTCSDFLKGISEAKLTRAATGAKEFGQSRE